MNFVKQSRHVRFSIINCFNVEIQISMCFIISYSLLYVSFYINQTSSVIALFEYCCHVLRIEREKMQEVLRLERTFFTVANGIQKAFLRQFHELFSLEDFMARRIHLSDKTRIRTLECDRVDSSVLQTAFTLVDNTKPSQDIETVQNEADMHKNRKTSISDETQRPPFYLKKHPHRVLGMKSFLLHFPAMPHFVRSNMELKNRSENVNQKTLASCLVKIRHSQHHPSYRCQTGTSTILDSAN